MRGQISAPAELARLLNQPRLQHGRKPPRDPQMQQRARRTEHYLFDWQGKRLFSAGRQQGRQGFAAELMHLQRALNTLRIMGRDPGRGRRVQRLQPRMQGRPAALLRLGLKAGAQAVIGRGQLGQALFQRAKIEARAAGQQRRPAPFDDVHNKRIGRVSKARR